MRKLIASLNITIDGFCDHTAVIANEELHENANELLHNADTMIFGRVTYQLMERSWPPIVKNPTGDKAIDEFAELIDHMHKIVFSRILKTVSWKNSTLASGPIEEIVLKLKQRQSGGTKNILVGSPSIIITLMKANLIDEYQFCLQPIILGTGLPLFKNISERIDLTLVKAKKLASGVTILNYVPQSS